MNESSSDDDAGSEISVAKLVLASTSHISHHIPLVPLTGHSLIKKTKHYLANKYTPNGTLNHLILLAPTGNSVISVETIKMTNSAETLPPRSPE